MLPFYITRLISRIFLILNPRFFLLLVMLVSSAVSTADPFGVLDRVPSSSMAGLPPAVACDATVRCVPIRPRAVPGWSATGSLPVAITPVSVLMAMGLSFLIGVFFSFYRARQAAGLNPIDALGSQ